MIGNDDDAREKRSLFVLDVVRKSRPVRALVVVADPGQELLVPVDGRDDLLAGDDVRLLRRRLGRAEGLDLPDVVEQASSA